MAVIDNLKLSKEAMETAISNFETRKAGLENAYLRISNEVRTLDGTWNGEASEKFKAQFETLYQNISQSEQVMTNIIESLRKALAEYTDIEAQASNAFSALDTGTQYQSVL